MQVSVALFLGEDGRTVSVLAPATVCIYTYKNGEWAEQESFSVDLSEQSQQGLKALREQIAQLPQRLGDTKILVAAEINGIAYGVLDTAGLALFEAQGEPQELLSYVLERLEAEERERAEAQKAAAAPVIEDLGEGRFFVDLKKLQIGRPELSSKKVLLPFLQEQKFYELVVICTHVPPWFERLAGMGFTHAVTQLDLNKNRVIITPVSCETEEMQ